MAGLGISFHILALYVSLLTHQIQGSRLLPINPEMWKGQHLPSEAGKDKPYFAVHKTHTASYF